jgi:anti-sigma factor RsiW
VTSCEFAHDDGAYVLGALAPAERDAYERHLAGCAECREAVAEIAVLPGLLGRLDPAGLDLITPEPRPATSVPTLLAAARRSRRRERRLTRLRYGGIGLVAAALALIAGLGLSTLNTPATPAGQPVNLVAMQSVRTGVPLSAEVGVEATAWGTRVAMRCHYPKAADPARSVAFRLVAHGPDGATEQVGSWVAGPGDDLSFTGATRFTRTELTRLELLRADGTPLLAYDLH